ncbi:hypothetical protein ABT133_19325 [Streptomyces sp. NPDC001835]|uniref:hypothetical protein n=1 Tax=unclassified Streptomyces TaxID=2593676 RepID=UPI0033295FA5
MIAEKFIEGRPLAIEIFSHRRRDLRRLAAEHRSVALEDKQSTQGHRRTAWSCPRHFDGPANFDAVLGTDGQERFIEANARLGGNGVPRLLAAAYYVDVVRALTALALGESSARPHPAQRNQLALALTV